MTVTKLVRRASVLYTAWGRGVAAIDGRTGKRIWTSRPGCLDCSGASPSCEGACDLALGNGVLYVVGTFGVLGGVVRHGAAALDPRTGRVLSWSVHMTWRRAAPSAAERGAWAPALAVAAGGDVVYLAGEFNFVNGRRHKNLVIVGAASGRPRRWSPAGRPGPVDAIAVADGDVLVGGGRTRFAAFDDRTGRSFTWPAKVSGGVAEFAVSGSTAYLGGNGVAFFTAAGGRDANNLAAVRLPSGRFTSWTPDVQRTVDVSTLAVSGHVVLVGGSFRAGP